VTRRSSFRHQHLLQIAIASAIAPDALLGASEEFSRMSQHKAQQILGFWRQQ
jgi:hypothetical protein